MLLSGLYFLLPLRWCARLALTVTVHELGHVTALILCGAQVCGLRMEGCGLVLRCTPTEGALRTGHGGAGRPGRRCRDCFAFCCWARLYLRVRS